MTILARLFAAVALLISAALLLPSMILYAFAMAVVAFVAFGVDHACIRIFARYTKGAKND